MDAIGRARQWQSAVTRAAQPPAEDTLCRIHLPRTFSTRGFDSFSYGVHTFAKLRQLYNIPEEAYEASFMHPATGRSEVVERFTEGKSGSFFYFTDDRRFLVKTVTRGECEFLRRCLPQWAEHFQQHPASLLTRFCGLHAIRLSSEQRWLYFCVMESVFAGGETPAGAGAGADTGADANADADAIADADADNDPDPYADLDAGELEVVERFDLKGSWVRRSTLAPGVSACGLRSTLKDGDLMRAFVLRSAAQRRALQRQMHTDASFLAELGIMDYSLLVGVVHVDGKRETRADAAASAESDVRWWQSCLALGVFFFLFSFFRLAGSSSSPPPFPRRPCLPTPTPAGTPTPPPRRCGGCAARRIQSSAAVRRT